MRCALLLLLALGCSTTSSPPGDDAPQSGGASSGGNAQNSTGGSSGGGAQDGGSSSGGTQNNENQCPPGFQGSFDACGECVETLADYCSRTPASCYTLESVTCRSPGIVQESVEEGCGFVRFSYSGDVGDQWGRVYDAESGALVYVWDNGRRSAGCVDAVRSGQAPSCDDWTQRPCESGLGGEGGGP